MTNPINYQRLGGAPSILERKVAATSVTNSTYIWGSKSYTSTQEGSVWARR